MDNKTVKDNKVREISKKIILIFVGSLALILGVIGIFLPILPTTPFLLLTAYCYLRSSDRLYNWLLNNKYLGRYISEYIKNRTVPRKIKYFAITFLWISLLVSILLIDLLYVGILLSVIGIAVSIHILSLKELTE